jgi:hypothetical protein
MYLLYCDESNLEERSGDFLIYGGLMIDADRMQSLSSTIDRIRSEDPRVSRDYRLKFNPGPENFSHDQFIELKRKVINAAIEHDAKLLTYVILHDISSSPDEARRNGINAICYHFHCLLNRMGQTGLVLIDRFNDEGNLIDGHLSEKFMMGVRLPYTPEMRLSNIVGFHYSSVGQGHVPSIIDILLGSFRFALNAHSRNTETHLATSAQILEIMRPLFIFDNEVISELSFIFSPKVIKANTYRAKYEALKGFLEQNGLPTAQEITDQRTY